MARLRKAAGTAVDIRNGHRADLKAVVGERFDLPPDVAEALLPQTLEAWEAYWADPVSAIRTPADRAVLLTWIEALDRHTRLSRAADAQPLVETSQGVTRNPLYAVAEGVWKVVDALQAQLGIGPKSRTALGIAVIAERKSLADLNAGYAVPEADPKSDPRLNETS